MEDEKSVWEVIFKIVFWCIVFPLWCFYWFIRALLEGQKKH